MESTLQSRMFENQDAHDGVTGGLYTCTSPTHTPPTHTPPTHTPPTHTPPTHTPPTHTPPTHTPPHTAHFIIDMTPGRTPGRTQWLLDYHIRESLLQTILTSSKCSRRVTDNVKTLCFNSYNS